MLNYQKVKFMEKKARDFKIRVFQFKNHQVKKLIRNFHIKIDNVWFYLILVDTNFKYFKF